MIEAAGGVIWRICVEHGVEILLIHRPRHDDWSLPKGKLYRRETAIEAAMREVREETGLRCEAGPELPEVRYIDRKGRDKRVRYWAMHAVSGQFRPNREVDRVEWISLDDAMMKLTYNHDLPMLGALNNLLATVA